MGRTKSLQIATAALLVAVATLAPAAGLVGGESTADPVTVEDGGTYQKPVVLRFEVASENGTYELRTADDRLFVTELVAHNGTVILDTGPLDPGEYVLLDSETDRVRYRFTLEANPNAAATETDAQYYPNATVEPGKTYPLATRLHVPVDASHRYEIVPLFDWDYAIYQPGDDGRLEVKGWTLRPGWYAVYDAETGRAVTTFRLTEGKTGANDERAADRVPPAPAALVPDDAARENATNVGDRRVLWRGQPLAFRVDGDADYVLRADNGTALGRFAPRDHTVYLTTRNLSGGMYTLERPGGHVVYRFTLASQTLSATEEGDSVRVTSNRRGWDLVVEAANLSRETLSAAFPEAVERGGRVVVLDVGSTAEVAVNERDLPAGNHTLTLRAVDTGVTTTVTVHVPTVESGADAATGTAHEAAVPGTKTPSPTPSPTPVASNAGEEPEPSSTEPSETAASSPGLDVSAALVALTLAVGLASVLARC